MRESNIWTGNSFILDFIRQIGLENQKPDDARAKRASVGSLKSTLLRYTFLRGAAQCRILPEILT